MNKCQHSKIQVVSEWGDKDYICSINGKFCGADIKCKFYKAERNITNGKTHNAGTKTMASITVGH